VEDNIVFDLRTVARLASECRPTKKNIAAVANWFTTIHEMQMISRKGNLMKTGLQQQLWKRDTKGKLLLTYVR